MKHKEIEEGVFYPDDMFDFKCCDKCLDVYYEKTYPAHTCYLACTNKECECHNKEQPHPLNHNRSPMRLDN